MSLSSLLGFNNKVITIWERRPTEKKNEIGKEIYEYIKHTVKGRWEYKTKVFRKNGVEKTSVAMVIVPFNPIDKHLLFEKGECISEEPGKESLNFISYEEVSRLGEDTIEWIIYL